MNTRALSWRTTLQRHPWNYVVRCFCWASLQQVHFGVAELRFGRCHLVAAASRRATPAPCFTS